MKNKIIHNIIVFGPGLFIFLTAVLPETAADTMTHAVTTVTITGLLGGLVIAGIGGVIGLLLP